MLRVTRRNDVRQIIELTDAVTGKPVALLVSVISRVLPGANWSECSMYESKDNRKGSAIIIDPPRGRVASAEMAIPVSRYEVLEAPEYVIALWKKGITQPDNLDIIDPTFEKLQSMTFDEIKELFEKGMYEWGLLFERLEDAGRILGNGHHMAQALCNEAIDKLSAAWKGDKT